MEAEKERLNLPGGQWVDLKIPRLREVLKMRELKEKFEKDEIDDTAIYDFLPPLILGWSYSEPVSRQTLEEVGHRNITAMFFGLVALTNMPKDLLKNFGAL